MKVTEKKNTISFIKKSDDWVAFSDKVKENWHLTENKNVILDLSSEKEIRPSHLVLFEPIAAEQKSQKKSFVIIASIDFDEVSDEMMIVPTLQEANDFIEMDEIERDLGF